MAGKTGQQQDKYDNLLLTIVKGIENKADTLTTEIAKQGVELKANTDQTRQLKVEVMETNGNVKELQRNVTNIEKVVFPENPVTKPSELPPSWLKDPQVQSLLKPILFLIGALVAGYLGAKGIPIPGTG